MTNMEIPAPLQRAWAAGIFEAKCKIYENRNELYFDSPDQAMLERFHEVTGCGYVRIIPPGGKNLITPSHRWATKSLNDTRSILLFVLPLLGAMKAAQAAKLKKRIEGNPSWQKRHGTKDT